MNIIVVIFNVIVLVRAHLMPQPIRRRSDWILFFSGAGWVGKVRAVRISVDELCAQLTPLHMCLGCIHVSSLSGERVVLQALMTHHRPDHSFWWISGRGAHVHAIELSNHHIDMRPG